MTWSRRPSYSCLHCALNWSAVGFGWPFGGFGAVFVFSATQSLKSGGTGIFDRRRRVALGGTLRRDRGDLHPVVEGLLLDRLVVDLGDGVAGHVVATAGREREDGERREEGRERLRGMRRRRVSAIVMT